MVAVLLTGMSGAGKSTALAALRLQRFETVDTDDVGWIEVVGGEPHWREDRIDALLDRARSVPLVVVGTVVNQGVFRDRFDAVILLTAPAGVLLDRVTARTENPYGTNAADRQAIRRDITEVEPLLRAAATHVVDTTADPDAVVAAITGIVAAVMPR